MTTYVAIDLEPHKFEVPGQEDMPEASRLSVFVRSMTAREYQLAPDYMENTSEWCWYAIEHCLEDVENFVDKQGHQVKCDTRGKERLPRSVLMFASAKIFELSVLTTEQAGNSSSLPDSQADTTSTTASGAAEAQTQRH